jgi:hypothetical protein
MEGFSHLGVPQLREAGAVTVSMALARGGVTAGAAAGRHHQGDDGGRCETEAASAGKPGAASASLATG